MVVKERMLLVILKNVVEEKAVRRIGKKHKLSGKQLNVGLKFFFFVSESP